MLFQKKTFHSILSVLFVLGASCPNPVSAQKDTISAKNPGRFILSGEISIKGIYSHGYKGLLGPDEKGVFGPGQRARLNFGYEREKIGLFIQLEDGRIWGESGGSQRTGFAVSQAYIFWNFAPRFEFTAGRMPVHYEDGRYLSYSSWDLCPKTHDAAIFKFRSKNGRTSADLGASVSNNNSDPILNPYHLDDYFKYLLFGYVSHSFGKDFRWSLLSVTDFQEKHSYDTAGNKTIDPGTIYARSAIGTYFHLFPKRQISAVLSGYGQFGRLNDGRAVAAYLACAEVKYKPVSQFDLKVAYEFISGNDPDATSPTDHAFNKFLGSTHAFMGIMDYFSPGGASDFTHGQGFHHPYICLTYRPQAQHSIELTGHYFLSVFPYTVILPESFSLSRDLGFEASIIYKYMILKDLSLEVGYAIHTPTPALEQLSDIPIGESKFGHFGYITLAYKPTFFDSDRHPRKKR